MRKEVKGKIDGTKVNNLDNKMVQKMREVINGGRMPLPLVQGLKRPVKSKYCCRTNYDQQIYKQTRQNRK